jgi:release factor glutamine methyltransferase
VELSHARTLKSFLDLALSYLVECGCNTSREDVLRLWRLAEERAGDGKRTLFSPDSPIAAEFRRLLSLRATGMPVELIAGRVSFANVELIVRPGVLVPRPETEELAFLAIEEAHARCACSRVAPLRVLDVGTGTGALALAIARAVPQAHVTAIDSDPRACELARENRDRNSLPQVDIETMSIAEAREAFAGTPFDIVVSNPPYVAERDAETLPREVKEFEPPQALFGGADGLDVIRELVEALPELLASAPEPGAFFIEIGYGQARDVVELCRRAGLVARARRDINGAERFIIREVS